MIKEEFLHYIWRTKNFDHRDLVCSRNRKLHIKSYGFLNPSDGPDFLEAKVEIGGVEWNGAIEIHINSSDWDVHNHSSDKNYRQTILHVVFNEDKEISISPNEYLPCLELKKRISTSIIHRYKEFDKGKWLPCESLLHKASEIAVFSAKEKALAQRLGRKAQEVEALNVETERDWQELGYQLLCRSFGLVHNADPFLEIARRVPYQIVKKNNDSIETLEAMFFGVSGMLDRQFEDEYPNRLKKKFNFLKKKYSLQYGPTHLRIKHKAVRPQNFATISISQFANLIGKQGIISKLMDADEKETYALLDISASPYWNNHYSFDKMSTTKRKVLGKGRKRTIIINAVIPTLYFIGKKQGEQKRIKKASDFLENTPPEKNAVIDKWKELGVPVRNAFDSQALLELKKTYCDCKRCMSCAIGHEILKTG